MLLPPFQPIYTRFDLIPELVKTGQVDAGVVIHEAQLTFHNLGLNLVCDLGKLFSDRYGGLPSPLGVNAIRLDLDSGLRSAITVAYRDSIKFAMSERKNAIRYSMQYSRGVNEKLTDEFVRMYVNEDSLNISADVKKAIDVLVEFYEKNNSNCE